MNRDDDPHAHAAEHPCPQGLIAANVALMTAYAQPAAGARVDAASQRRLVARKIVSNLSCLRQHPLLSAPLRQVMAQAHERWHELAAELAALAEPTPPSWPAPASPLRH
jgi:hypothetical protein